MEDTRACEEVDGESSIAYGPCIGCVDNIAQNVFWKSLVQIFDSHYSDVPPPGPITTLIIDFDLNVN